MRIYRCCIGIFDTLASEMSRVMKKRALYMEKIIFIAVCAICGMAVAAAQMSRMDKGGGKASGGKNAANISKMNERAGRPGLREQLEESKKKTREQNKG